MKWPWQRPEPQHAWAPPDPIPDYDTIFPPGYTEGRNHWLTEPTMALPTYRPLPVQSPLLTLGARWRSRGSR